MSAVNILKLNYLSKSLFRVWRYFFSLKKNLFLSLTFFSLTGISHAQTYEIGCNFFRNGYRDFYQARVDQEPHYKNGFTLNIRRLKFADSIHPVFKNMELGIHYYQGKGYYAHGSHFGTDWENFSTTKVLATAAFYPINIRMFQKKTHLAFGGIFGGFAYINTYGKNSSVRVKDTTIPSLGHMTYGYNVEDQFSGKTRYDRRFMFGLGVQINQNIYTGNTGTLKAGLFSRFFVTPEFTNKSDFFPRQFGLQLTWMFKPHTQ